LCPASRSTFGLASKHADLADQRVRAAAERAIAQRTYSATALPFARPRIGEHCGEPSAWQAAADGLLSDHLRIHKAGKETRTARGRILAACAVVVVAALVTLSQTPPCVWVVVAAATGPLRARAGRPAHKQLFAVSTLPATVQAPSQDVITRALGSLGIAGIDRWLRDGRELVFPSPVREDGPGWRAEVDLPYG
jgi:DNA segregation ATPase FtsK/SpoIIIE, S-DNA-T family